MVCHMEKVIFSLSTQEALEQARNIFCPYTHYLYFRSSTPCTRKKLSEEKKIVKMQRLPYNFAIFEYCGMWRPINWTGWKSRLYNTYTCIVVVMLIFYYVCYFINVWYSIDNLPEFTNNSFVLLTEFGAFCKALTLLIKRRNIIDLGNILESDICQARDTQEIEIQRSFDQDAKYVINFTNISLPHKEALFLWKKMILHVLMVWYVRKSHLRACEKPRSVSKTVNNF